MTRKLLLPVLAGLLLNACSQTDAPKSKTTAAAKPTAAPPTRWYTQAQVARGGPLFQQHCATCHRPDASGDPNWKEVDANGKLRPPPLNGTAHAWHHPLPLLRRIVRTGGVPMGGTMPPFGDKLTADQIDAILAWVQSHWSDQVYAAWQQIDARKRRSGS